MTACVLLEERMLGVELDLERIVLLEEFGNSLSYFEE